MSRSNESQRHWRKSPAVDREWQSLQAHVDAWGRAVAAAAFPKLQEWQAEAELL